MMIIKIAWRNIWRNKLRSSVIIIALALGLWAGVFVSAFVQGMMKEKVDNVVRKEMSHFQFHHQQFREEKQVIYYMQNATEIEDELKTDQNVLATSSRVVVAEGNINTSRKMGALKLIGVNPEDEAKVTLLDQDVVEGEYFVGIKKNPILISEEIAKEYGVKLASVMIFKFLDVNGFEHDMKCRVVGIFNSGNKLLDKTNAYVLRTDLQKQLGMEEGDFHEIAVYIKDQNKAEELANNYQKKYSELEIIPWLDLSTGMRYMIQAMGMYTVIIVGIILFALLFSILNVMLMAVLERVREIGMLMAVGMSKKKVFAMVMFETLLLSIVGAFFGLIISWISIKYSGQVGIDLGDAAYGEMGFSNVIYPYIDGFEYVKVSIMVFVMAMIAAIYPSVKALRLKPVEAIRKI